jgi:histidinol-phosphate aminotransferase
MPTLLDHFNADIAGIKPYEPGRPIEEVARELGLDPATVVKLASNENALGASPKALAAARESLNTVHMYPDGGAWLLRNRIAANYELDRGQVMVGNGSNEILELVGHGFLGANAGTVFSRHAFVVYKLVSHMFGAPMREVEMAPGLVHDLDAMAAAINDTTRVVFICNPANPTGTMVDSSRLIRFVEEVPRDVLIVIDEAYAEVALAEMPPTLELIKAFNNVLICRTFSKGYGLAGFRLGYGLGCTDLIGALQKARQPFNVNLPAQAAGTAALDDHEFLDASRANNAAAKAQLQAGCERLGLAYIPSFANFMLIEVGDGATVTARLQEAGVIVRPMGGYELPRYIRVTFGREHENDRFLKELANVIRTV